MSEVKRTEEEITREGNPRKPQGEEGKVMLDRMNHSHYEDGHLLTGRSKVTIRYWILDAAVE